jgi:hypothetical protein
MSLTKEDLLAIREIVRETVVEVVEEKLSPIKEELASLRKLFTAVLNIQADILDKIELMDGQIKLIMFHLNLSPESREMKNTLNKLRQPV